MTILDTFYLLFRTDSSGAKADVAALDKQISELAAKGKKRSEEENKQLAILRKDRREATQDLKDQTQQTEKLGLSFASVAEGVAGVVAAYAGFSAIKNGVLGTAALNSGLEVQAKISNQSAGELRGWSAAIEAAGGSSAAFLSTIDAMTQKAADAGLPLTNVTDLMRRIHGDVQGLSPNEQRRRLGLLGIGDPGMISLMQKSNEEFERNIEDIQKHSAATQAAAPAARAFQEQWSKTSQSFTDAYSALSEKLLPSMTTLLVKLQGVGDFLSEHKEHPVSSFIDTENERGRVRHIVGWNADPSVVDAYIAAHKNDNTPVKRSQSGIGNQNESLKFWIGQGYTPDQAAGIAANEARESGFNPYAIGDAGKATGAFQWHSDRVAKILAATGIDVRTAGHMDQLRAAAWELESSGIGARLKRTGSAGEAAALFSRQFERPANGGQEAFLRAGMAAKIAQTSLGNIPSVAGFGAGGGGDKNISIKTGDISIHTAATDAGGISRDLSAELTNQFRVAASNFDDGVDR